MTEVNKKLNLLLAGSAFAISPLLATVLNQQMMSAEDDSDLSDEALALLDKSLDEIEDLPGFDVPYNGRYVLKANHKFKRINDKTCVEIALEVMSCIKKDNDGDPDTVEGTKFSSLFFLTGEEEAVKTSMGLLKQFATPIGTYFNEGNLSTIVREHIKDLLIAATCVRRKDQKNPEIFRARLSNVEVAA